MKYTQGLIVVLVATSLLYGQINTDAIRQPQVFHGSGAAKVLIKSPRPLAEAIRAISEEYGWIVNYEGPIFAFSGTVESNGRRLLRTTSFESTFDEPGTSSAEEERVLRKVVSDYNLSGNNGTYSVRKESDSRYAVIGEPTNNARPVFDTIISIPTATRSADATIEAIFEALSNKIGLTVVQAGFANNDLINTTVTLGGENVSARTLLLQTIGAAPRPQVWMAGYDPESNRYVVNVSAAARVRISAGGNRTREPITGAVPHK